MISCVRLPCPQSSLELPATLLFLTQTGLAFASSAGYLNIAKCNNAAIILSDSVALHDARVDYKELSGFLGMAISALRSARRSKSTDSAEKILDGVIGNMKACNKRLPSFLLDHIDNVDSTNITESAEDPTVVKTEDEKKPPFPSDSVGFSETELHTDDEERSYGRCKREPSDLERKPKHLKIETYGETATTCTSSPGMLEPMIEGSAVVSPDLDRSRNKIEDEEDFEKMGCELLAWSCSTCQFLNEGRGQSCVMCLKVSSWP